VNTLGWLVIAGLAYGVGIVFGWIFSRAKAKADRTSAEQMLEAAKRGAETLRREAKVAAQQELLQAREVFEKESKEQKRELSELEKRISAREASLDKRAETLDRKLEELEKREQDLAEQQKTLAEAIAQNESLEQRFQRELQRVSGLSRDEAKAILLQKLEGELREEGGALIRRRQEEAAQEAEREAKRIITIAMERCAAKHVQTHTAMTLSLPNEEMKGRIIGREGRNIRAFEAATGVNVLIDDTPQAVVLSGFDPVRREVARRTMERLVADGRIHPTRIEETVAEVNGEMDKLIRQLGEEAVAKCELLRVHPEAVKLLGRLHFRHSFAQNVLDHSIEVAHLAGMMAAEMGLDAHIARRVGLFHDIGKAVDHQMEGSHAVIGGELLKKYGESEDVWRSVACHHGEIQPMTLYGMLANAADAISASRPGARNESVDLYIKRLEKLEELARSFDGVGKCYAIQAGREIRVIVNPKKITDNEAADLARKICKKIEAELHYPGQIKVTVVRETRTVEYAK
jgi:ribonuclease Y